MRYWITTHWPPRRGDTDTIGRGIWLPHDKAAAGAQLRKGDMVLVYQSQSGRTRVRVDPDGSRHEEPCLRGRGGVVAVGRALRGISRDEESKAELYVDGSSVHWLWYAPVEILSTSGFVSRQALNPMLGYVKDYVLRGFGDLKSGLKEIEEPTYRRIEDAFRASAVSGSPAFRLEPRAGGPPGGEDLPHLRLKQFVAGAPAVALREDGLLLRRMEHPFPSGDRADVVLDDRVGRIVGVEIEVHVGDLDIIGVLQALKYAAMLEPLYRRNRGDSRAVLVAYSVAPGIREVCARYGVECHAIAEAVVDRWHHRDEALVSAL